MSNNMLFSRLIRSCRRLNLPKNLLKYHSICNADVVRVPACATEYVAKPYLPTIQCERGYAKGKNIKKEKGKSKIKINESELLGYVNVDSLKNQMEKALDVLKEDFTKQLSLRSTAGSIESIVVNVDGTDHTLQELAQIVRKNPKTVVVNMAVFPQAIPDVVKAISSSGMNLNPQQEGTTLYIPVPKVTKEHRENMAKSAKSFFVKCKDSIRDTQMKHIRSLKKQSNIAIDTVRELEQQIVAIADSYIQQAENIFQSKQSELIGKE